MIHTPKFPIQLDDKYVWANAETTKEVVHFHLKNLLFTFRGEKLSDPQYGVGIQQYLFEPLREEILNLISDRISEAIRKNLVYIPDFIVDVLPVAENPNAITIKIRYRIPTLIDDGLFTADATPSSTGGY